MGPAGITRLCRTCLPGNRARGRSDDARASTGHKRGGYRPVSSRPFARVAHDAIAAVQRRPAEATVLGECRFREGRERLGNFALKLVPGDIELLETWECEVRDRAGEMVAVETKGEEAGETVEGRWHLAGEVVVGQIQAVQADEGEEGGREPAGEAVVGKEEELEGGEVGEVGYGAGEAVVLEAEDSELTQLGEGLDGAGEVEVLEDEAGDAAVAGARDAGP